MERNLNTKILENNIRVDPTELVKDHDNIMKAKSKSENLEQLYKYEINKINKLIKESNNKYRNLISKINAGNTSRNAFLRDVTLKYAKIIKNLGEAPIIFSTYLETLSSNFNNCINKKNTSDSEKFQYVTFIEYAPSLYNDNLISNDANIITESNMTANGSSSSISDFEILSKDEIDNDIQSHLLDNVDSLSYEKKFTEINTILLGEEEISSQEVSNIINFLGINNNIKDYYIVINWFLEKFINRKNVIKFKSEKNLIHFSNILNTISVNMNIGDTISKKIEMNIIKDIVILGAIACYKDIYMCSLLSKKNKFYSTKTFWSVLIETNFINNITAYYNDELTKRKIKTEVKTVTIIPNESKDQMKRILFTSEKETPNKKSLLSSVKNFFTKDKKVEDKKKNEQSSESYAKNNLIEISGYSKYLDNYDKLLDVKKSLLNDYAIKEITKLLSEFIPYMCYFCFPYKNIMEIILYYSNKFKFSLGQEYLQYFEALLNVEKLSRKKGSICNNERIIAKNNWITKKKENKLTNLIIIISKISKFLPSKEIINLLLLSKTIYVPLKKKIIKRILIKRNSKLNYSIDINTHIKLWSSYLEVNKTKEKLNYAQMRDEAEENLRKEIKDVIELDVHRTSFFSDENENKSKLRKILRCMIYQYKEIGYCQGMNYFIAFLLEVLDYNEEETYYYTMAILERTEYAIMFSKDLIELKQNFFAIDKIISVFMPQVEVKLSDLKIKSNFYAPPWFLTLFTSSFLRFERKDTPLSIFFILDTFIVKGYRGVLLIGLSLINSAKNIIINYNEMDIFEFMISKLIVLDILKNENFPKFIEAQKKVKIGINFKNNLNILYKFYIQHKPYKPQSLT